jgi:hypothetical protein
MKHVSFLFRSLACPLSVAAFLGTGACGSNDEPANPTPPPTPTPDAGSTADTSVTPDTGGAKPDTGPVGLACGTRTCYPGIVGGQPGAACCTPRMTCGLDFTRGCIDQEDGGGTPIPPADANPIVVDPSCGQLSVDFMGIPVVLDGCCLADGMCGYYSPQMTSFGCSSLATLGGFGFPIPDAAPKTCSLDGSARPDVSRPDDGGTPDTSDAANQDSSSSDSGGADAGNADSTPPNEGGADGGGQPDAGSDGGGAG